MRVNRWHFVLAPMAQAPIFLSVPLGLLVFAVSCLVLQALPLDDLRLARTVLPSRVRRDAEGGAIARPRVCVVRQMYYDNDPLLRREVDALVDDGFDVDILCMRRAGDPAFERAGAVTIRRLPLSHVRGRLPRYLFEYAAFLVMAGAYLTVLHLRRGYDAVQVNTPPDTLVFAAIVPRITGTPVILHLAETMPEFFATKFRTPLDGFAVRAVG